MIQDTTNSPLKRLSTDACQQVQGGHYFHVMWMILEAPHVFMGVREFVNYAVDRAEGAPIEEGDHFSRFFFG